MQQFFGCRAFFSSRRLGGDSGQIRRQRASRRWGCRVRPVDGGGMLLVKRHHAGGSGRLLSPVRLPENLSAVISIISHSWIVPFKPHQRQTEASEHPVYTPFLSRYQQNQNAFHQRKPSPLPTTPQHDTREKKVRWIAC